MKKTEIKKISIIVFLIWAMLFSIPVLSQRTNNIILLICEIIVTRWFCYQHKGSGLVKKLCIPIIFLGISFIITTLLNNGLGTRTLNAVVTGYKYVILFYSIGYFVNYNKYQSVVEELYVLSLLFVILSDIVVIISGGKGIGGNEVLGNFCIGDKFAVSYLHMLFLSLYQVHSEKNKGFKRIHYIALVAYSIVICYIMECSTGVVGCVVMLLYMVLDWKKTRISQILENPISFLAVFFSTTFLLVGTDLLLRNSQIANLFLKYSHTSKMLTGRLDMYEIAILYFHRKPWIGYGINCTIVEEILTWGNAQNGLLKLLIDHGIVGTTAFSVVLFTTFYRKHEQDQYLHRNIAPFIALLYGLAICSMVEICLVGHFYLGLAIVNAFNHMEVHNVSHKRLFRKLRYGIINCNNQPEMN